jgi:hypothetical protein
MNFYFFLSFFLIEPGLFPDTPSQSPKMGGREREREREGEEGRG